MADHRWTSRSSTLDHCLDRFMPTQACQRRNANCYRNSPRSRNSKSSSSLGLDTKTQPKLGTRIIQPLPYCSTYKLCSGHQAQLQTPLFPTRRGRECCRRGEYHVLTLGSSIWACGLQQWLVLRGHGNGCGKAGRCVWPLLFLWQIDSEAWRGPMQDHCRDHGRKMASMVLPWKLLSRPLGSTARGSKPFRPGIFLKFLGLGAKRRPSNASGFRYGQAPDHYLGHSSDRRPRLRGAGFGLFSAPG